MCITVKPTCSYTQGLLSLWQQFKFWMKQKSETMSQGLKKKRKWFKILGCVWWGDAHVNEANTETQAGIKMSCESQEIQAFRYEAQRRQFFLLQAYSSLSITRLSKMCKYKVRCMHVCVWMCVYQEGQRIIF